jgi:hypothetical protein
MCEVRKQSPTADVPCEELISVLGKETIANGRSSLRITHLILELERKPSPTADVPL